MGSCGMLSGFRPPSPCDRFEETKKKIRLYLGTKEGRILRMIDKQFEIEGISHHLDGFQNEEDGRFYPWKVDYREKYGGERFVFFFQNLEFKYFFPC